MRNPVLGPSGRFLLTALVVSGLSWAALPVSAENSFATATDPRLGPGFLLTVERATERLARPGCAMLLQDFTDLRSGRPLAETLAASGRTTSTFLESLRFVDADHMLQCRLRPAYAWIPVGGDVVFVCRSRFAALARKDEWLAGNVLLHETLHSLGLGENPPSSEEITRTVIRRCGR